MTEVPATASAVAHGEFRVGRVISRAFAVFFKDWVKFIALGAITVVPFIFISAVFLGGSLATGANVNPNNIGAAALFGIFGGLVLWIVLYVISQAVILYGAFQVMRRRPFQIGDSLKKGLARFLPIIGLAICIVVAMMVGFLLLVVPGFIILTMLYVALPVCVVEGRGPFQSMGRSADLTKGYRWRIFGLYLVIALVSGIAGQIVPWLFFAVGGGVGKIIGSLVWQLLAGAYQAIAVAVAYHDLRVAKDGIDIEGIAAVFD